MSCVSPNHFNEILDFSLLLELLRIFFLSAHISFTITPYINLSMFHQYICSSDEYVDLQERIEFITGFRLDCQSSYYSIVWMSKFDQCKDEIFFFLFIFSKSPSKTIWNRIQVELAHSQ